MNEIILCVFPVLLMHDIRRLLGMNPTVACFEYTHSYHIKHDHLYVSTQYYLRL
jgi:hypothetical protein